MSPHRMPCWIGERRCAAGASRELRGARGAAVAALAQAPGLSQVIMLEDAVDAGPRLAAFGARQWFALLREAGQRFLEDRLPLGEAPVDLSTYARIAAEATGIPTLRVVKSALALANALGRMEDVLEAHAPEGFGAPFSMAVSRRGWTLAPAGRHVAVRLSGGHPTENLLWLLALAWRRPAVLCAQADPFTPARLVEALYAAGLPAGAVSLCYGDSDGVIELADQVIWSGDEASAPRLDGGRVRCGPRGRGTAVLLGRGDARLFRNLAGMAVQGSGRMCTNLRALLVDGDATEAGLSLASALARWRVAPLDDAEAIVPAFPDRTLARWIDAKISAAEARGAVDLIGQADGEPRLVEVDGACFLRPVVMLVDPGDPIFGAELPFPFVTVARASRREIAAACRDSYVVSMVGDDERLLRELVLDPTIEKVLHGDWIHRVDRLLDPLGGFVADCLFRRQVAPRRALQHASA